MPISVIRIQGPKIVEIKEPILGEETNTFTDNLNIRCKVL